MLQLNNSHVTNRRARALAKREVMKKLLSTYRYTDANGKVKIAAGVSKGQLKNMAAAIVMKAAKAHGNSRTS
jgi:hypothetical protein